jgi:site-specific DNA-methyltransferase (adenine-specific)
MTGACYGERTTTHPDSPTWIAWDKRGDQKPTLFADVELAWTNLGGPAIRYRHWWGVNRASERGFHVHPTQKPVALMRWIIDRWTEPGDLVLDPYMGSGPVAQACHELGRRYIGVELVEDYCKVAVSRLAQQTFDFGGAA